MKLLHFSDTHLGYSELDKVSSRGINLREQDFYDSFAYVVDQAVALQPDLILHSGDFFHRPSPTNRALTFALEQLQRLANHNIPIALIAGNHETPKTIYTSPILKAFSSFSNIYPMFGQSYETQTFGDLVVHGLPHINDPKVLSEQMDRIHIVPDKFNIILLHTSIGKDYLMEEYGEQLYPPERLELLNQFDYVALGHWHNFQQVKLLKTAWYAGSTERMSETEIGKEKGYCLIELVKGQTVVPQFHSVPARPWYRIDIKKCETLTVEAIKEQLETACASLDLNGALLSLYFHQISNAQALQLNNRAIRELPAIAMSKESGPVHISIKRQFAHKKEDPHSLGSKTESLDVLLKDFIGKELEDSKQAESLTQKALHYFSLFESGEYRNR